MRACEPSRSRLIGLSFVLPRRAFVCLGVACCARRYLQLQSSSLGASEALRCAAVLIRPRAQDGANPSPAQGWQGAAGGAGEDSSSSSEEGEGDEDEVGAPGGGPQPQRQSPSLRPASPEVLRRLYAALARQALAGLPGERATHPWTLDEMMALVSVRGQGDRQSCSWHGLSSGRTASELVCWFTLGAQVRVGLGAGITHAALFNATVRRWMAEHPHPHSTSTLAALADVCRAVHLAAGPSPAPPHAARTWEALAAHAQQAVDHLAGAPLAAPEHWPAALAAVLWCIARHAPTELLHAATRPPVERLMHAAAPVLARGYAHLPASGALHVAQAYASGPVAPGGEEEGAGALVPLWLGHVQRWTDTATAAVAEAAAAAGPVVGAGSEPASEERELQLAVACLHALGAVGAAVPARELGACLRATHRWLAADHERAVRVLGQGGAASPRARRKRRQREGQDALARHDHRVLAIACGLVEAVASLRLRAGVDAGVGGGAEGVGGGGVVAQQPQQQEEGEVLGAVVELLGWLLTRAQEALQGCRDADALQQLMQACTTLSTAGLDDPDGDAAPAVARGLPLSVRQMCVDAARTAAARRKKVLALRG